jgi:hypothetical protein
MGANLTSFQEYEYAADNGISATNYPRTLS